MKSLKIYTSFSESVSSVANRFLSEPSYLTQLRDQFTCLPLPLMSLKGFSCSRAVRPFRSKASLINSIKIMFWSMERPASSQTDASSYWLRATYKCFVLQGIPISRASRSIYSRARCTFLGILPQQCSPNCWLRVGTLPTRARPKNCRSSRSLQEDLGMAKNYCSSPTSITAELVFTPSLLKSSIVLVFTAFWHWRKRVLSSRACPRWEICREGRYITPCFRRMQSCERWSHIVYPRARWVCLSPPEGILLASPSPLINTFPENESLAALANPCFPQKYLRLINDSCFSHIPEVWGQEMKLQWSTPFVFAHSYIFFAYSFRAASDRNYPSVNSVVQAYQPKIGFLFFSYWVGAFCALLPVSFEAQLTICRLMEGYGAYRLRRRIILEVCEEQRIQIVDKNSVKTQEGAHFVFAWLSHGNRLSPLCFGQN